RCYRDWSSDVCSSDLLLPLLVTLGTLLILGASKASAQTCPGKHGIAYVARDCDCDGQPDVLWPTCTSSGEPCDGCNMDLCDYCCPFECLKIGRASCRGG